MMSRCWRAILSCSIASSGGEAYLAFVEVRSACNAWRLREMRISGRRGGKINSATLRERAVVSALPFMKIYTAAELIGF